MALETKEPPSKNYENGGKVTSPPISEMMSQTKMAFENWGKATFRFELAL
jgi:hypothetical protein